MLHRYPLCITITIFITSTCRKKAISSRRSASIKRILKIIEPDRVAEWVMPAVGFKLRAETDTFFEQSALKGKVVFVSDVVESLTRSVVDEVGIALLPLIYVPQELKNKTVHCFGPKEGFWKHRIWLTCHQNNKDDDLIKILSKSFIEVCDPLIN